MTRGDQIRAYVYGLSELLEQVDHEDMVIYLHQDETGTARRLAEIWAQERALEEWEN